MHCRLIIMFVLAFAAASCSSSRMSMLQDEPELPKLPPPRMSSDSVGLELCFVDVPSDDPEWETRVWAEFDEQVLTRETRRELLANGFRLGVIDLHLPSDLRTAIDQHVRLSPQGIGARPGISDFGSQVRTGQRRLHLRSGKRSEIVTGDPKDSIVVLLQHDDSIDGHTFREAQTVMGLRAFPLGNGHVRLELVPEIQHGPKRQRWVGRDGMFQMEAGRDREVYHQFKSSVELAPGQTVAITTRGPARSLGGNFFDPANRSDVSHRMLLIRLAQSQYDDLFGVKADSLAAAGSDYDQDFVANEAATSNLEFTETVRVDFSKPGRTEPTAGPSSDAPEISEQTAAVTEADDDLEGLITPLDGD